MLTHGDPLVAVWSSQPVTTLATVVAAVVSVALAGAVEKPQGPPLSVITPAVRILRSVLPVVRSYGDALASTNAGAALILWCPRESRAALAAPQSLQGDTLPGELGQRYRGTQDHHQDTHFPHAESNNLDKSV